jgi:glutaconyl-CoA/methylmalonyl-CoA decarboxylase subunit gamma
MSQHVLRVGGREYQAEVKELTADRATVVVDGKEYLVDLLQVGRRNVLPEAVRPAAGAAPSAAPLPVATRAAAPGRGEGSIPAPMPGLILALKAKEGDTVQAGQTLLVMEAMKMENAITAPYSGTVSKIYVREGDSVGEGDLLVDVARPKMTAL